MFRKTLLALAVFAANGLAQPYIITTIAGTDRLLDGKPANTVPLRDPLSLVADGGGGLYIADGLDNRIRRINAQGFITTVAGNGIPGYSGDRGKATLAQLNGPRAIVPDSNGNLYIADYDNNLVPEFRPTASSTPSQETAALSIPPMVRPCASVSRHTPSRSTAKALHSISLTISRTAS
jgi:hypothetical protein